MPIDPATLPGGQHTTGRLVVVFARQAGVASSFEALHTLAGIEAVASSRDFAGQVVDVAQAGHAGGALFDELGVAVVNADPDQRAALLARGAQGGAILSVEPELIHHTINGAADPGVTASADYMRGYRDGVSDFAGRVVGGPGAAAATPLFADTDEHTWGLLATNTASSPWTGLGVSVAVLDTGFDLGHPDFADRAVTAESFVQGESAQDAHGHGTHCVGTACGSATVAGSRRYGVAGAARIYVGKVLGDGGSGSDMGILAGVNWAVANSCQVVSMSLGADVRTVSRAYEVVGRRALDAGSLIVAAAGNNARRPGFPGFVGVPANSPSIMAVGALDPALGVARFSATSNPVAGGQIDLAGPGVAVYSAWPAPELHHSIDGTSMATPHVAGIAALWAEATGHRGRDLWLTLTQHAVRLPLPSTDVGDGLVQAPPPGLTM